MIKVSIVSLIYQSEELADWVYDSVHRFTPMITRGDAEFFFVANDPTPALMRHLRDRGYRHVLNINERYSDDELYRGGYAKPEYMSRVYRGYNEGLRQARGDYVVLINSDNFFSPDWLENLLKYSDRSRVISSTLVERHHPEFSVFPGAVHGEFGATVDDFDEVGFLRFASHAKRTGVEKGGAFMPTLFHRDIVIEAGLYPCGNIAGRSFEEVAMYGDEAFFETLRALGVSHYTALDSIVYHLKEGERATAAATAGTTVGAVSPVDVASLSATPIEAYPVRAAIERILDPMAPNNRHEALMASLVSVGEPPATRTLRQLLASGLLSEEQAKRARIEIANPGQARRLEEQAKRLAEQSQTVRNVVGRVVGPRRAGSVMRALGKVSWLTRPVRRALVSRNHKQRDR